jgi:NhaA family Na+:H+ antiporter
MLRHESAGGVTVGAGALVAVLWSLGSPSGYRRAVNGAFGIGILAGHGLGSPRLVAVNALLVVFFFAVGLELSREFRSGARAEHRRAIVPALAALGGMAATAGVLELLGRGLGNHAVEAGWGVPMATDIAFTLGALALVGRRVPVELRVFLLTLAVADDLLAVVVLAARSHHVQPWWLLIALAAAASVLVQRRPAAYWCYLALVLAWVGFVAAHVEPALAGAAIGVVVPFDHDRPGRRLERQVLPWSNAVALPLFALTACGIAWDRLSWQRGTWQLVGSLLVARLAGKVLGITGAVLVARWRGLSLAAELTTGVVAAAAVLCAIGFTVPLLFAGSVYGSGSADYAAATVALLATSLLAAALGITTLRLVLGRRRNSVS